MATVYWLTTSDLLWDTASNWYSDNPPTTPYGTIPLSGDGVVLTGPGAPSGDPAAAVTLALFDSSQLTTGFGFSLGSSGNIVFSSSAAITLGISGDSTVHTLTATGTVGAVVVQGGGLLIISAGTFAPTGGLTVSDSGGVQANGTLDLPGCAATFSGSSALSGSGSCNFSGTGSSLTFSGSSTSSVPLITISGSGSTPISFQGSSVMTAGTISVSFTAPVPAFSGSAQMTGGTADKATFANSSVLAGGTISTLATFNNSSTMTSGTANAAAFHDSAVMSGGTVGGFGGTATFDGSSQQTGGTIGTSGSTVSFTGGAAFNGGTISTAANLTIDSTADQTGTYNGSTLTVTAGDKTFSSIVHVVNTTSGTLDVKVGPGGGVTYPTANLTVTYPTVSTSDAPTAGRTVMWFGSES